MRSHEDAFDLAGLRELQLQAGDLANRLSAGDDPHAPADGFDMARTVRMTIDESGRVVDAEIGQAWRELVGTAGLGPAVVEAITDAERARMEAWTAAAEQNPARATGDLSGHDSAGSAGLLSADGSRSVRSSTPSDPAALAATRELFYLAMEVMDRLGEISRKVDQETEGTVRAESPDRRVSVTVEAGRVVGVDFDHQWLAQASPRAIAEQLRAAFAAADRADHRSAVADALNHPTIRELREVTADPGRLLRRLGLS